MTTRVAIVTGAAQGIGRAVALRLAQDGFDVAVDGRARKIDRLESLAKEIRDMGRKSIVLTADVTDEEAVKRMVEQTVESLGRLDVMVANAGVGNGGFHTVVEADMEIWENVWAVNIRGTVLCYKYAARQMIKQKSGGRIIGDSPLHIPLFFQNSDYKKALLPFVASKDMQLWDRTASQRPSDLTAMCALTTARELYEHNITVNAYAPGIVETELTRSETDEAKGGPGSAAKETLNIPHARTGQPSDVASLVSYLASPEAHFITGQTLTADGGATV